MFRVAIHSFSTAAGLGVGAAALVLIGYAFGLKETEPIREAKYAEDVRLAAKKLIDASAAKVIAERRQRSDDAVFHEIVDPLN